MERTARAAVLTAPRTFELLDVPVPDISDDDALLEVEACGICGSDIAHYTTDRSPATYPIIPGHEPVGRILAIGDRAARRWGVGVGDRVGVEPALRCGRCDHCRAGHNMGCTDERLPGPTRSYSNIPMRVGPGLWGGYAEVLYLDREATVHRLPDGINLNRAALLNAMASAVDWAVLVPRLVIGSSVVILGCGQRGLLCVVAAREAGAGTIIVTGLRRDAHKLEVARALGADHVVCVDDDDVVAAVPTLTQGAPVDLVIDATSTATGPVVDAIRIVRPGGTVVLAGIKGGRAVPGLVSDEVVLKEITLRGVLGASSTGFRLALGLLRSTRQPLHLLHTHSFGLEGAADAVLTLAGERGDAAIAVTINP